MDIEALYGEYHRITGSDTSASILVLSAVLDNWLDKDESRAELFGHNLNMALKNVLEEQQVRISVEDMPTT